jgi:GNAT superfamily N-acetyltransferase
MITEVLVCSSIAYSKDIFSLRVPFDAKYDRLKILNDIVETINTIDDYLGEKENLEKLAAEAMKEPQYTKVIIDGLMDFRHKRRFAEALANKDPQRPNLDISVPPERLFPIKEISQILKLQDKADQFRTESPKYEKGHIEMSLFLKKGDEKIATISLYVPDNILEVSKHNPKLSRSMEGVLWNDRSGYFERPAGEETERVYYNLNWWAGISGFWIRPSLRKKGLASIWVNSYIEPYLLKSGFELFGPEGRCFELREYAEFWKKQGFPAPFALNQLYHDPEAIIFYVSVKRLQKPASTLAEAIKKNKTSAIDL